MKTSISAAIPAGGLARLAGASALALGCAAAFAQLPTYRVVQLPAASPTTYVHALAMNDAGDVVGNVTDRFGQTQRPAVWPLGSAAPTMLAIPSGAVPAGHSFEGYAYGINNKREVVGFLTPSAHGYGNVGLRWTSPTDGGEILGTRLKSTQVSTGVLKINDSGTAIGSSAAPNAGVTSPESWSPTGQITKLGSLAPAGTPAKSYPQQINASGVIVGYTSFKDASGASQGLAFEWTSAGGIQELQTPAGSYSVANAINNPGTVVGSIGPNSEQPALWTPEGELQTPADMPTPLAINDAGVVLGFPLGFDTPVYWTAADGAHNVIDLVDPTDPLYPALAAKIIEPAALNQNGWILLTVNAEPPVSYLLIPE